MKLKVLEDPLDHISKIKIIRRSKSIAHKRLNRSVMDATDYYKKYNETDDNSQSFAPNFIGECYLGLSKLLQSEYRHLDKRDSNILQGKFN